LSITPNIYDKQLLERLKAGDKQAFSLVFSTFYRDLVLFANTFTHQTDVSEEIVQEVFVTLWENVDSITIKTSLKSYLLRMVQNKCLDWLRHLKVRDKYAENILDNPLLMENDTENYLLYSELEKSLEKALGQLPEEFAKTFRMNRIDGLKQNEIAEKLGIAVRTVEFRIARVLKLLRDELKDYFIVVLIFLLYITYK
jgi:RNA polymerase sigma-70 factor (ECF subfamily)